MPAGDGTGPQGLGPMTGRAAGYCAGYPAQGYMNPIPGRGFGFGRGWGRGRGFGRSRGWGRFGAYPYAPEPTSKEEMDILREESEALKQQLQDIQDRMKTLEKTGKGK